MLKEKQLREFRPTYQYEDDGDVTLENIEEAIKKVAVECQVPIAFERDQIKFGGLFNSEVVDCIVMYHPEHKRDYYKIAISIRRQGGMAYVMANDFGESKNEIKLATRNNAKQNAKKGAKFAILKAENGSDMMGALMTIGKGAIGGILSLGGSKRKQEMEENYYRAIVMILDEVIC